MPQDRTGTRAAHRLVSTAAAAATGWQFWHSTPNVQTQQQRTCTKRSATPAVGQRKLPLPPAATLAHRPPSLANSCTRGWEPLPLPLTPAWPSVPACCASADCSAGPSSCRGAGRAVVHRDVGPSPKQPAGASSAASHRSRCAHPHSHTRTAAPRAAARSNQTVMRTAAHHVWWVKARRRSTHQQRHTVGPGGFHAVGVAPPRPQLPIRQPLVGLVVPGGMVGAGCRSLAGWLIAVEHALRRQMYEKHGVARAHTPPNSGGTRRGASQHHNSTMPSLTRRCAGRAVRPAAPWHAPPAAGAAEQRRSERKASSAVARLTRDRHTRPT